MSWQTSQLTYAFGLGGLMSFYGIVGLIVFMLPSSTMGNTYKIVTIALILLTLPFVLIIGFVTSRSKKKKTQKAVDAAAAQTAPVEGQQQKIAAPSGTYADLTASTEEAVQFLKSSNLGESGKDAVYSLPWYIVAGAPKAGKSSLVLSSNLNFQTLPSQRQSELKFIRPTSSVDWRVTSDAVFVDTAGRYQTEGVDADEWSAMLETIKKYRANRPLDGFLLVVNAETILKSDEREMEEAAKVLRARLDDAVQRLKVRFPVYLVFTHADSIEGFRDSFSTSKNEDKTLVWGATVPLERSDNAQALFDGEYELLHNSVMKRRLARLSAPFPPVRQLRIFNFPLHFGSARRKFGAFVNALFRPNPFSENPFLRGFYFTASPAAKATGNAPATVANGHFTERFFRDVVLRDKDLVKTFLAQRQRPPIFGWFATVVVAILTILLLVMSGVSLLSNRQMLEEATIQGEKALVMRKADAGKDILAKKEEDVRREISTTEDLRALLYRLDDYERNGAPIYMRFGLYSGNKIYKENLLPLYFSIVEQRFKTPTIKKVEAELKKFSESNPVANPAQLTEKEEQNLGKHYDLLKAYLMLSGDYREKAEGTHISSALKDYWVSESKTPADLKAVAQQQLDFWAKQVDRQPDEGNFPRISLNAKLVDDTRKKLQAFPAVYRYYSRKVTEISKEVDDKVGPTTAEAILTRNGADTSFMEGNIAVPSAFTRPGHDLMKVAIKEAREKLSEDDWVMGELGKNELAQTTDEAKLEDRYYRDYADNWRSFVKGVEVKRFKNKDEAQNAMQAFSQANSPMKILVREVARNTNLSAPPDNPGWIEWLISLVSRKQDSGTGTTQPEKEFRPLFDFIGKKDDKDPPIEKYQSEMGRVYNTINGLSEDAIKKIAEAMAAEKEVKITNSAKAIGSMLSGFGASPSSQEVATLLQKPITNLKDMLGAGTRDQLAKQWTEQLLPDAKEIEKGFPFDDGQSDADLTKLTAYLNPADGKFSKFYDDKLAKYFEESNGQLKLKETAEVKFSDDFIAYLNNAVNLRKALFGSNPAPKFEYEFTLRPSKDALIEVTIDGQTIKSEGTGSIKGAFPAGNATETGVLMTLASTGGTTSSNTSGPATSGDSNSKKFPGNWGLFRFVDAGGPQKQSGGEYALSYSLGGKTVSAVIKPSGGDLFNKNIFLQLKAPANLLK